MADPHRRIILSYPIHKTFFLLHLEKNILVVEKEKVYANETGVQFLVSNLNRLNANSWK
jgi:hypothetical protein